MIKSSFILLLTLLSAVFLNGQTTQRTYQGQFGMTNKLSSIETNLVFKGNTVKGSYTYGNAHGTFEKCQVDQNEVSCQWIEGQNSKGTFRAIFKEDFSSFIGIWFYASGKYGGAWLGKVSKTKTKESSDAIQKLKDQ